MNALIKIVGTQTADGDEDVVELTTNGTLERVADGWKLRYHETEATGMEGTHTSVEIGADYVSLQRTGNMTSDMLFMKDRKTSSYYNTPYGDMQIDIFTDNLNIQMSPDGGRINVDYFIDINNLNTGKNNFEIEIRKA